MRCSRAPMRALYRAKHGGRNRLHAADDEPAPSERARLIAAARNAQAVKPGHCCNVRRAPGALNPAPGG